MYKPLDQIIKDYKDREKRGEKRKYYSPSIKSHIRPFKENENIKKDKNVSNN